MYVTLVQSIELTFCTLVSYNPASYDATQPDSGHVFIAEMPQGRAVLSSGMQC